MPVINFQYDDFVALLGAPLDRQMFLEKVPMMGVSVERAEGDDISIEVFPNRPDLLSVEGMARSVRAFLAIEPGFRTYDLAAPTVEMAVDPSVSDVRPFVMGAVVRKVTMTDELITSLMEMQEKLHFSVGKDRKKMAIGVHDMGKVAPPFTYTTVAPNAVRFVPLDHTEAMTPAEVLHRHDKGRAYAHLLEKFHRYPLIVDAEGAVLSFPPVINGELTALRPATRTIFIDVTGTDRRAVSVALAIIATALAERGGTLEQVRILEGKKATATPDLAPRETTVALSYVNRVLGLTDPAIIEEALHRMGHATAAGKKEIVVRWPAWRADILHPVDIVEDIAIGYGYDRFAFSLPRAMTFGSSMSCDAADQTLIGLGFTQVVTLSLSSREKEFDAMRLTDGAAEAVELENPVSADHTIVKTSLLPSLLEILSKNRHNDLPQRIFEVGDVVVIEKKPVQRTLLAGAVIEAKASFTQCKSYVEAIMRAFGQRMEVTEKRQPSFVDGRCAHVLAAGTEVGYFGELHPAVITAFGLEYPVIAFELNLSLLFPAP
jgi:phenylalanyl-tRNA synthetase beta chain